MNPSSVGMHSFDVHVCYKESGEVGYAVHLVYAHDTNGVVQAMKSFYGNDLIAVVFV